MRKDNCYETGKGPRALYSLVEAVLDAFNLKFETAGFWTGTMTCLGCYRFDASRRREWSR